MRQSFLNAVETGDSALTHMSLKVIGQNDRPAIHPSAPKQGITCMSMLSVASTHVRFLPDYVNLIMDFCAKPEQELK